MSARKSLLIVDADTKSLRVLEVSLRKVGFGVETASTASAALQSALTAPPDLVITDTRLPDFDGFELCRRLRKDPRTTHAVVVFLTEGASPELKVRGIDVGGDEFLTKPVLVKEIIGRIRMLLERRPTDIGQSERPGALSGTLANMGVVDLLQVMEAGEKGGVAKVVSDRVRSGGYVEGHREQGLMFFRDGQVVDAELGRLRGAEAVFRMMLWEDGLFEVEFGGVAREDAINQTSQELMLAGLKRVDDWSRYVESLPPLQARLRADLSVLSRRRTSPPREVQDLVGLFDGRRTLFEAVAQAPVEEERALKIVAALHEQGVLRPSDDPGEDGSDLDAWLAEEPADEDLPSVLERAMIPSPQTPSEIMAAADPGRTTNITRQRLPASHVGPIPGAVTEAPGRPKRRALKVQKIGATTQSVETRRPSPDPADRPAEAPLADTGWGATGSPWAEKRQDTIPTLDLRESASTASAQGEPPPPAAPAPLGQGASLSEQAAALQSRPPAYAPSEASTFKDDFFNQEAAGGGTNWTAIAIVFAALLLGGALILSNLDGSTEEDQEMAAKAEADDAPTPEELAAASMDAGPSEDTLAEPVEEAVAGLGGETSPEPKAAAKTVALPRRSSPEPEPNLELAARKQPTGSIKTLLAQGEQALEQGFLDEAEESFLAARDKSPENAQAQAGLAFVYWENRKDAQAKELAQSAIDANPKQAAMAYVVLALAAIAESNRAGARSNYERYLELRPRGYLAEDIKKNLGNI